MIEPYNKEHTSEVFLLMSVPETPSSGNTQTIFYFRGAENTNGKPRGGQPKPSGEAILQPVLTYGPNTKLSQSHNKSKSGSF